MLEKLCTLIGVVTICAAGACVLLVACAGIYVAFDDWRWRRAHRKWCDEEKS